MARHTGSVCRFCRREGTKLFLKGERCYLPKCSFERRPTPPGARGKRMRKESDYLVQLREKQKVRRFYGVTEKQFHSYYMRAVRKKGVTGAIMLQALEMRLDSIVYRMGFAASRSEARQLVCHGHFNVNGRRIDIPSYGCKPGDVIQPTEKSSSLARIKAAAQSAVQRGLVPWVNVDPNSLKGEILDLPAREQIDGLEISEQLIVEFYSR